MNRFEEKQGGRIFTDKLENIAKIEDIIKKMNEGEYDYLPENLITVFKGVFDCVYNHKFYEIDLDELIKRCEEQNIVCGYIVGRGEYRGWGVDYVPYTDAVNECIKQFYQQGYWDKDAVLKHYKLDYLE